jgi:hypothetical protein
MMKRSIAFFCGLSLVGCSTQMHTRPSLPEQFGAVVGVPYALPVAHLDLTLTRTLVGCEINSENGIERLEFEAKIEFVRRFSAGERFVIDYSQLGNWHKTSGFKLTTYPNQTLKAINAEADDRSPEILGTTVKTALTFARVAALGSPMPIAVASELQSSLPSLKSTMYSREQLQRIIADASQPSIGACPPEVARLEEAREALDAASKELLKQTRRLDVVVVPALIGLATEEQKQEIAALRKRILELADQQSALQRQYDAIAQRLRFFETATLTPKHGSIVQSQEFAFPSRDASLREIQKQQLGLLFDFSGDIPLVIEKLLRDSATLSASLYPDVSELDQTATTPEPNDGAADDPADAPKAGSTKPGDEPAKANQEPPKTPNVCTQGGLDDSCAIAGAPDWGFPKPKHVPGIAYRDPSPVRVRICKSANPEECRKGAIQPLLVNTTIAAGQLGRLVILPFRNGFGENNSIEAVFREDGALDWLKYDAKDTSGESLATLLEDGSSQFLEYRRELREQEKEALAEAAAAPGEALDRQIALLERQLELAQLANAVSSDSVTQQQELTRLQAEIARLTALRQIRDLEAALRDGAGS